MTFVEVLVAMGLVAVAATGLAELVVLSTGVSREARVATAASLVAEAKLAELRALPWGDVATDLTVDPPASGGPGLGPSPVDALAASLPGYSDYVDADGRYAGRGPVPPSSAAFVRRWSVVPLSHDPDRAVVLQVVAARVTHPSAHDAHVVSVLARTAR